MREQHNRWLKQNACNLTLAIGVGLAAFYAAPALAVTTHFAVVRQDGAVSRSSERIVVERTDKGTYAIVFPSVWDISKCAITATIGTGNEFQPSPGLITVMEHPLQAHDPQFKRYFFVQTRAPNKQFEDRPFHLILACN